MPEGQQAILVSHLVTLQDLSKHRLIQSARRLVRAAPLRYLRGERGLLSWPESRPGPVGRLLEHRGWPRGLPRARPISTVLRCRSRSSRAPAGLAAAVGIEPRRPLLRRPAGCDEGPAKLGRALRAQADVEEAQVLERWKAAAPQAFGKQAHALVAAVAAPHMELHKIGQRAAADEVAERSPVGEGERPA
eukprot:scaffold7183_cov60-Phaeocystis_antarctica.AAC.5